MEKLDFDDLYNELYSSLWKNYMILSFGYSRERGFYAVLTAYDMEKITKADIVVLNHKTKQYRVFKYVSGSNDTDMIFKCDDIPLTLHCQGIQWYE